MAGNAQGPWTHPDAGEDESWPTAFWSVVTVTLSKGTPLDGHAVFHIWKDQQAKQAGRRPRGSGTIDFNYVAANGNVYNQALSALLAAYPTLTEV